MNGPHHTEFGGGSIQSRAVDLALRSTVKQFLRIYARSWRLPWPVGVVDEQVDVVAAARCPRVRSW